MLRTLQATRYVTPLREGGSLPAVIEAEDDGLYVLKFRAAGQGTRALIAELISGEIARTLGLRIPELVYVELDPALGRNEPDYEIRELLTKSAGLNLGMDYLPGSITYDPLVPDAVSEDLASRIVWFDAFTTNVDRTPRNTNMLTWHRNLWIIDNGASLFFHHTWSDYLERSKSPFVQIKDHVLLPQANRISAADYELKSKLTEEEITRIVRLIPDSWLEGSGSAIYIGGFDHSLIATFQSALKSAGFSVFITGHKYPGMEELNICNRGSSKKGVQFELTLGLRENLRAANRFADIVRGVLRNVSR